VGVSISTPLRGRWCAPSRLWDCVFPVSAVVGAAVPTAVCRWGLARAVLMWGGVSCLCWVLAFTRYCFTSRLYCTIIFFANTPFIVQYIAQYYRLLHPRAQF